MMEASISEGADHAHVQGNSNAASVICRRIARGAAVAAQAHVGVSVGVNVGVPVYGPPPPVYYGPPVVYAPAYGTVATALPSGAVSVTIGGGRYWRYAASGIGPMARAGSSWRRRPRWCRPSSPKRRSAGPSRPDPNIYPRNGQSAEQMGSRPPGVQPLGRDAAGRDGRRIGIPAFHRSLHGRARLHDEVIRERAGVSPPLKPARLLRASWPHDCHERAALHPPPHQEAAALARGRRRGPWARARRRWSRCTARRCAGAGIWSSSPTTSTPRKTSAC